jgi:hypothetical protein
MDLVGDYMSETDSARLQALPHKLPALPTPRRGGLALRMAQHAEGIEEITGEHRASRIRYHTHRAQHIKVVVLPVAPQRLVLWVVFQGIWLPHLLAS